MPDTPLTDEQHADIRQRIAAAFEREDAQNWGYDHGFCADPFGDPETGAFVDAALAVVQPELDRLRAERDQARADAFNEAIGRFKSLANLAPDSRRAPGINFAIGALMSMRDYPARTSQES